MVQAISKKQKLNSKNGSASSHVPAQSLKHKKEDKVSSPSSSESTSQSDDNESEHESASESESELEEESDDEIEDDEIDVGDVSSGSGSESESGSDEDDDEDDIPKKKKNKSTDDGSNSFSSAMSAILNSKLKAYDRNDPMLVRSKKKLRKFEDEKLEQKARRAINAEKKQKLNSNRVRDLLPKDDSKARQILDREKAFKKVAQRGVIKLFNAVLLSQTSSVKDMQKDNNKVLGVDRKEELINEISKEKFLDLVQSAGKK